MTNLEKGKDILLFYEKHKWDYVENYSKRTISGFYAWYALLVRALKENGYRVYENNYELARSNPSYPVGLVGTPICIPKWDLPNPAILGPSMYDHPSQDPTLMQDKRFKYYLLTCEWLKNVFSKVYGNKCVLWHAGISTDEWVDVKNREKTIDVLIYDKIRWERKKTTPLFLDPIKKFFEEKNLSYFVLRYGDIAHEVYKDLLSKSRTMVFLCEHETQGIAYQEALASNIPIIAWDHGWWTDPVWPAYSEIPIPATSVPLFSCECGEKFKMIADFPKTFEKFLSKLESYNPRQFIQREVSFKKSADMYCKYYFNG
ncbi:MAG: glycosyltransferase [Patescibacteria group bacterium]